MIVRIHKINGHGVEADQLVQIDPINVDVLDLKVQTIQSHVADQVQKALRQVYNQKMVAVKADHPILKSSEKFSHHKEIDLNPVLDH